MPTFSLPPTERHTTIMTPAMTDAGIRRLLLSMSNHAHVQHMSRRRLAQCLERMADSEHVWTMRWEILTAAARALAPEIFDDLPDVNDDTEPSAESAGL